MKTLKKIGGTFKNILTDPAMGFAVGNILLFASGGGIPLAIAGAAAAAIAGTSILKSTNPKFLQHDNWFTRFIKDDRAPLWIAGASMGAVGLTAAASGLALAAMTSAAFMGVDFALAESVKEQKQFERTKQRPHKSILNRVFTGPDLYVTIGLTGAAVMTGGLIGAVAAPFIALSSGVAFYNAVTHKHESNAHPKVLSGASCLGAGLAGIAQGNPGALMPAMANIIFGGTYINIEGQITEGGLKTVAKDVLMSPLTAFKYVTKDRSSGKQSEHSAQPDPPASERPHTLSGTDKRVTTSFTPQNQPKAAQQNAGPAVPPPVKK